MTPQLGRFELGKSTPAAPSAENFRLPTLTARLGRTSAAAYARMGGLDEATRCLAKACDGGGSPEISSSAQMLISEQP
jgi:hypothetical protein